MTKVTLGKVELKPAKTQEQPTDNTRLREFLKNYEGDEHPVKYNYATEMMWDCVEKFGYKETKSAFEHIEASLTEESKKLVNELRKVLEKKANVKLKERWLNFNKQMRESSKIEWQSLPKKKTENKESPAEDILSMIRKRQQN